MVRYKVVPEPREPEFLVAVRDALPLVPGRVEDCCSRIRDETALPSRDVAREWLTFCQALGLARETDRGFHRVREDVDRSDLRDRFLSDVFAAREVRDALGAADGPLTADEAFEAVRGVVPRWERDRSPDWEDDWRERVEYLLGWLVAFEVAVETDDGYRLA